MTSVKGNNMGQVPVHFLAKGLYMLRLVAGKEIFIQKFLIE
jgi:hypothetical protein